MNDPQMHMWWAEGKAPTSPLTGMVLTSTELKPNHLVRSLVTERMRAAAIAQGPRSGPRG